MIDRRTSLLFFALSIAFFVAAWRIGSSMPSEVAHIRNGSAGGEDSTAAKRLALINTAVREVPLRNTFEYTGGFENPFKSWKSYLLYSKNTRPRADTTPRGKLSLKGILSKDRPLAILENALGETQIRGIGEKAFEQLIVSISDNRVTLRDHLGTYALIVEEH